MRPATLGLRNVHRYEHNYFYGWVVQLMRGGQTYVRYFRDAPGASESLRAAIAWRDEIAAALPPPRKFKRWYKLNTTGVVGVSHSIERTRAGRRVARYSATWVDEHGTARKRSFSVARYGERKARAMAIRARREALAELLRPVGRRGAPQTRHRA